MYHGASAPFSLANHTMQWQTTRFLIDLARPQVMGIVNLTPDSFSNLGDRVCVDLAMTRCAEFIKQGADILDLGAESTRPGAIPVSLDEELSRLLPVLEAVLTLGCPVSVDTYKPEVMAHALSLGVDIINDINALRSPGAMQQVAAHRSCGVCLLHMRGEPNSMQSDVGYDGDIVEEVSKFLRERSDALQDLGVSAQRIVLDPGIGFGKSVEHNIALLRRQRELLVLGLPLLVGWSRKSTLGAITGRDVTNRLGASVAAAMAAVQGGARIVRVHDVAATVDALRVWDAAGLGQR